MKRMHVIISGILLFTVVFPLMSMYSSALEQAMSDESNAGTGSDTDDNQDQSQSDSPVAITDDSAPAQAQPAAPASSPAPQDTATQQDPAQPDIAQAVAPQPQPQQATPAAPTSVPLQPAAEPIQSPMPPQQPAPMPAPVAQSAPLMNLTPTQPVTVGQQGAPAVQTKSQTMPMSVPQVQPEQPVATPTPAPAPAGDQVGPVHAVGQGGVHTHTEHNFGRRHSHGGQVVPTALPLFSRSQAQTHEIDHAAWQNPPAPRHSFAGNKYSREAYRKRKKRKKKSTDNPVVVQNQNTELPPIASFRVADPEDRVTPASQHVYAMEQNQVPRGDLPVQMPTYPCQHMGNMPNDLSMSQQLDWLITDGCKESLDQAQNILDTTGRKKYIRYVIRKFQERIDAAREVIQSTVAQR